jgi:hypothetical protein
MFRGSSKYCVRLQLLYFRSYHQRWFTADFPTTDHCPLAALMRLVSGGRKKFAVSDIVKKS